jgi:EAL domain-containing protein (putative c-di-GMP-specific phosphodiesterase class I)/GGDEF domain-containing protein
MPQTSGSPTTTPTDRPSRAGATGSRPQWLGAAIRVRLFIVSLVIVGIFGYLAIIRGMPPVAGNFVLLWPLAALGFYLGETNVVVVHFLRERHSFSLSELPGVMGLFLLSPTDYVLAYVVGAGAALLLDRNQSGVKRAYNIAAQVWICAIVGLAVFHAIAEPGPTVGARDWVAAFASSGATAALGAVLVATVFSLSGGAPQFTKLPEMLRFSSMVAMANTSLALLAVMVIKVDPRSALLLAVPTAIVFLAYRAYIGEREKHERLELLHESSRLPHYAPELDRAISAPSTMPARCSGERAELLLFPDPASDAALRSSAGGVAGPETMTPQVVPAGDALRSRTRHEHGAFHAKVTAAWTTHPDAVQEAMVGPLVGEHGTFGAVTIINRLGEGSRFEADDLRLLETIANQAAVALENGQLEQSLHELSRLKEQLRHQAYHDSLTGLGNRALFVEESSAGWPARVTRLAALCRVPDLDDFKVVNDTYGHPPATRCSSTSRSARGRVKTATCSRGSAATSPRPAADGATVEDAMAMTERIIVALEPPFPVAGTDVIVGCSVGISVRGGELVDDRCATPTSRTGPRPTANAAPRSSTEDAPLDRRGHGSTPTSVAARKDLAVFYQPIVQLTTGRIVGVEALVRWRHPTRGLVDPADFIRLAEENGKIVALGRAVLQAATAQVVEWHRLPGLETLALSVNLSPLQLQHEGFIDEVTVDLRESGIDPRDLTFEMTETAMLATPAPRSSRSTCCALGAADRDGRLRQAGFRRRLPGCSSRSTSPRRPRAHRRAGRGGGARGWAFAAIPAGRSLGLTVVAEGIETDEQLRMLRRLGCELGQGYLLGRPASADEIEAHLLESALGPLSERVTA